MDKETPPKNSGIKPKLAQPFQVLDQAGLNAIHHASLQILEQNGIVIEHKAMLDLLRANGCHIEDNLVRLPARLIERCINHAPSKVTLYARDPQRNVYLGEGNVHFTNEFGATFVEDPDTCQVRPASLKDLADLTRLADSLERVDFVLFSVVPQDVPVKYLDVECTAIALQNTTKHIQLSLETAFWLDEVINMGRAACQAGQPLPISAGGVPNSPLHYTYDSVEKFMVLGRNHIPCFVVCGAMAGVTAPVTLAGALALQNAEVLAGVVINQLAEQGAPVVYGSFTGGFDMRVTKLALGGPEIPLMMAASQQLAKYYNFPVGYATGGVSDSMTYDIQAGLEKATTTLFAALAGVDVIHDGASGLLGGGMLTSLRGMVIGNDLCNAIAYLLEGIPVDPGTIASEVIRTVGPGGSFIDHDHTAKNFRKHLFSSTLRARNTTVDEVDSLTASIMLERAAVKARRLLESHHPAALTPEQLNKIEKIRKAAYEKME